MSREEINYSSGFVKSTVMHDSGTYTLSSIGAPLLFIFLLHHTGRRHSTILK